MGQVGLGRVVRLIQTLWDAGTVASLDDAELLGRFLRRDAIAEAAFAALVQRHAPMVLRVCCDVTGDPHDAQDAAQATFLILARKARSIRRGEALGNWLFGTARRVAARAVRDSARRRRHERAYAETVAGRRESGATHDGRERDWAGLYEELERLPERYRAPLVLCDLESLTHDQAAVLGCPRRTLQTRLYRGRERLRRRLVRRGLMPAIGLLGDSFAAKAGSATVPTAWSGSTARAAMRLATGQDPAAVALAAVTALIQGVNRAMFLSRLKSVATCIVIVGLSAGLAPGFARLTTGAGTQTTGKTIQGDRSSPRAAPGGSEKATRANPAQPPTAPSPAKPASMTTPITVRGRATDIEGKPVAGATIFLVSTNGTDAPLGTTTTDHDGSYIFRQVRLPVSRWRDDAPLQGTFQVYGTAPGHGFAWHGMRFYHPRRRPDDWKVTGEDYSIFGGEPMVMDLRFPPAATLIGRIVDEAGRPVADASVRVAACDYLDTEGKESQLNFREFWAIQSAPVALTMAKTGPDGRFRLDGLPKEAGFWVHVKHPAYAWLGLYAATTARPTTAFDYPLQSIIPGQERPPVETGELNVTLHATRRIAVRTVFADSSRPAPRVRVTASRGSAGSQANGTTDAEGKLLLRLPPGKYDIRADPTEGGAEVIRTKSTFAVTDQPAEQSLEVRVEPGCVLILEVVDAKTGEGIPGVTFLCEQQGQPGSRVSVQSRSGYIDNPRSDAQGRLRAVVEPGERIYSVGHIPESSGHRQQFPERRVVLPAGRTVTVRFELNE
jgi:RNA polymerase sigma factor (sigma-70 family)